MPFDLAACAVDLAPTPAEVRALGDAPGERSGPPPALARIPLLDAATRARHAAAIIAALPAAWAPVVELDATGMAAHVAIDLPGTHTAEEMAPIALAFVRAHACLFGVTAPEKLSAEPYAERFITLARDPVAIGGIAVALEARPAITRLTFDAHMWPIAALAPPVPKLTRYLGRAFAQDREMWNFHKPGPPGHMTWRGNVSEHDLRAEPGPALVCTGHALVVRPAIWVELDGKPANGDRVLAELPAMIDLRTQRPIGGAWIAPQIVESGHPWAATDRANDAGTRCGGTP
jgi:hypothetical protein